VVRRKWQYENEQDKREKDSRNESKRGEKHLKKKRRRTRTVARPIVRGGGGYSYVRVLPDGFLLKAIVFTVCEHECMNIPPPPPIIVSSYGPAEDRQYRLPKCTATSCDFAENGNKVGASFMNSWTNMIFVEDKHIFILPVISVSISIVKS
jgi:hypothetical protein